VRPLGPGREVAPGVRVLAHLARSHYLDVYDAWCARRACHVVVKTLRPNRLRDTSSHASLLREGELLCRLAHPHIVRGYDVHDGARPVIVLETLGGETLSHLFHRRRRRLAAAEVAHLGLHLASALAYLHGEGILHLDLKPSNVIADSGRAKLIDLSLARAPGRMDGGRGTWCNMSPEQARGGEIGPATDVFGLGTVLWEAAAGRNPFEDLDAGDEYYPQLVHRAAPVATRRRVPAPLARVIDGCLADDAAHRPTLDEAIAELAACAA
jgi:eukaryotic-like serine/threonine-protein kinase